MERPALFAGVVVLGLLLLPIAVWLDLRALSDDSLEAQAQDLNKAISDIRSYYSRNVVGRVLSGGGDTMPAHNYAEIPGAIPIPATLSIELGGVIGSRTRNIDYRFVSDHHFKTRAPHNLDAFEKRALETFRKSRDPDASLIAYSGSFFDRKIRIAAPVIMGGSCIGCHNAHPDSPRTDWSAGDVRGIQAITIAQPITNRVSSFKFLLLYLAGAGLFGAAVAGHQWRQAARFLNLNQDLESANSRILGLNEQLQSENLRLGAELDIARRIQRMVLPTRDELDAISSIEIAAYMEPADEVGGDYYDVLQDGHRIKIGIGDVTGHGLESGVLMLMVQSVAVALQERGVHDPKEFLETLNRAIHRNIERTNTDRHLTLCFLDYEDHRITLAGQHEDVLILRGDGEIETIDTIDLGFPIGLDRDISALIATTEIPFSAGDVIILHTDGVTEAESPTGELFGMERLRDSADRHRGGDADAIVKSIIADVKAHIDTQKVHDDITLIAICHR